MEKVRLSSLGSNKSKHARSWEQLPVALSMLLLAASIVLWSLTLLRYTTQRAHCGPSSTLQDLNPQEPGEGTAGEGSTGKPRRELIWKGLADSTNEALAGGGVSRTSVPEPVAMPLSLTIFTAPGRPYYGADDPQRHALLSWLQLSAAPRVVLFGSDPSFQKLAEEFPGRVEVESRVDTSFTGEPQVHSMLGRAMAAPTALSMLVHSNVLLLNDLVTAVERVHARFDSWLVTGAQWDVVTKFMFRFEPGASERVNMSRAAWEEEIKLLVRSTGTLHTFGGLSWWVWNNGERASERLHKGPMPPFLWGHGKYDNWLIHEVLAAGYRTVVDASDAAFAFSTPPPPKWMLQSGEGEGAEESLGMGVQSAQSDTWQPFMNLHLAFSHGSYINQAGTALHAPWRLTPCHEPSVANMCLQRRLRPANCSCEHSPFALSTQTDPQLLQGEKGTRWSCGKPRPRRSQGVPVQAIPTLGSPPGLPHILDHLLPVVAKRIGGKARPMGPRIGRYGEVLTAGDDGGEEGLMVVTLVAVTLGYSDLLMNFVCHLRRLGLAGNLLVAALDEEVYRFAAVRGLAVYHESSSLELELEHVSQTDCSFGTECFREVTKLKSRAVLRVIKLGYSVLLADVDMVWFADPLPHLLSFGAGVLPIQSSEPNGKRPATGMRGINSGFYFARAEPMVIEAFRAIVKHARGSSMPEQPGFYDVLCGPNGEHVVKGRDECHWRNGLRIVFLDRKQYPRGGSHDLWSMRRVPEACLAKGCVGLHVNWVKGERQKKEQMVKAGLWYYNEEELMCVYPWQEDVRKDK